MEPTSPAYNIATILRESFPHGHLKFIPLCLEEIELHSAKNADYARGGDPLGNFKRVSLMLQEWGLKLPPSVVAWIDLLKQVDAVGNMLCQGYEGEVEGVAQKLKDISVYAKLAMILHERGE